MHTNAIIYHPKNAKRYVLLEFISPLSLWKIPTDITPQSPAKKWFGIASTGSSTLNLFRIQLPKIKNRPPINPITNDSHASTQAHGAVILISPAQTPLQNYPKSY